MNEFQQFVKYNKEQLYNFAESYTVYDSQGRAVLTKDDNWRIDYIWDRGDDKDETINSNC